MKAKKGKLFRCPKCGEETRQPIASGVSHACPKNNRIETPWKLIKEDDK